MALITGKGPTGVGRGAGWGRKTVFITVFSCMALSACTTILGDDFLVLGDGGTAAGGSAMGGAGGTNVGGNVGGGGSGPCTPNTTMCLDDTRLGTCDSNGVQSVMDCPVETPQCEVDACVACTDDDLRCNADGSTLEICAGGVWTLDSACEIGCDADACLTVTDVSAGSANTCVVLSNGTVRCWGYNALALMMSDSLDNLAPAGDIVLTPTEIPGITDAKEVFSGNSHNCVVTEANDLQCWGFNGFGTLGTGDLLEHAVPVDLDLGGIQVSAYSGTFLHSCIALANGVTRCSGLNVSGQLGYGPINNPQFTPTPQMVTLPFPATTLATGENNTCAVDALLEARCWGDNGAGQLGISGGDRGTPVSFSGGVTQIAIGARHICYFSGGAVRCVGANNRGQLGQGSTGASNSSPQVVPNLGSTVGIDAARDQTCAWNAAGDLACWGRNVQGEIGIGAVSSAVTSPNTVFVNGMNANVRDLAVGEGHVCMVNTSDEVWCWGANYHGQVGLGTQTISEPLPKKVVW